MAQKTILDHLNLSQHYDNYVHPLVLRKFPALGTTPDSEAAARLTGKLLLGALGAGGLASLVFARDGSAVDQIYGSESDRAAYDIPGGEEEQ
jgi:hypothetical protein